MSDQRLSLSIADNIATITFDDGKVNALDNDWFKAGLDLLAEVESSDASCLIMKGREGLYSGGLNIKWLPTMSREEMVAFGQLFPGFMKRLYHFAKPTIAQVTGHAIAGGCIIACACDRRVAIRDASVAMNEVRVNMTIPEWAIDIVMDTIPAPYVKTMLKFGDPVTTNDLHQWGVIDALADNADDLDQAAAKLAASFEGISPMDFAGTKARVRDPVRQ